MKRSKDIIDLEIDHQLRNTSFFYTKSEISTNNYYLQIHFLNFKFIFFYLIYN